MTVETAHLVVRLEGHVVQTLALVEQVVRIGRTPDNTLSLPHPLVARQHAELRLAGSGITITDLGSSSGTLVGGVRLLPHQPQPLSAGTLLRIGPFEVSFEYGAGAEVAEHANDERPPATVQPSAAPLPIPLDPPRPTMPSLPPIGPRSRYLADLPGIYQDSDFLGRYLQIFETIWEPLEQRQDHIAMYFDPATCPAPLLPVLARWLDLQLDERKPEARKRALLAEAMDLYRWRGTRYGLGRMIELTLGVTPELSDEPGQPYVMRVRVHSSVQQPIDRRLLEETILLHKPAHVGYILEVIET